jgi:hypothetical protein
MGQAARNRGKTNDPLSNVIDAYVTLSPRRSMSMRERRRHVFGALE